MAKALKYVLQNIHDNDKARAFRRNILHERGPLLINLCKCNGNDETKYQNHLAVKTFNMPKKLRVAFYEHLTVTFYEHLTVAF